MINNMYGIHVESLMDGIYDDTALRVELMTPHIFPEFNNTREVIAIYAGYMTGPNNYNILNCDFRYVENYILSKYTHGTPIVFDNLHEGGMDVLVYKIHDMIDRYPIDGKDIYYFVGLADAKESYEDFCLRNNITKRINVAGANPWELGASKTAYNLQYHHTEIGVKEKNFLCFNRVWRTHRYMLLSLLLEENLVKDSYYSYFPSNTHAGPESNTDEAIFSSASHVIQDSELVNRLYRIYSFYKKLFPLTINIAPEYNKTSVDHEDLEFFDNSYFSLVTETFFFDLPYVLPYIPELSLRNEHGVFFSEKIYKPIIMKHPFIIVSRPRSLEYLRKSGYKTFHPFIDETYDTIENNNDRMLAIVKEVKRLSSFSKEEWLAWQEQVQPIYNYNYSILVNKKDFVYERHYV